MVARTRRATSRWIVRAISVSCALLVMYMYSTATLRHTDALSSSYGEDSIAGSWNGIHANRHLMSAELGNGSSESDEDKCTKPWSHHGYNDSCEFVKNECKNTVQLFNYLGFVVCQMKGLQVRLLRHLCSSQPRLQIAVGHWPFSEQISKVANQNLDELGLNCMNGRPIDVIDRPNLLSYFTLCQSVA